MMDRLTEEVRQEPLYHVCRWHCDLLATAGGRGMKVTCSKIYKWLHLGCREQRFKERETGSTQSQQRLWKWGEVCASRLEWVKCDEKTFSKVERKVVRNTGGSRDCGSMAERWWHWGKDKFRGGTVNTSVEGCWVKWQSGGLEDSQRTDWSLLAADFWLSNHSGGLSIYELTSNLSKLLGSSALCELVTFQSTDLFI